MSPFHKKGITRGINQTDLSETNLYEYITAHWLKDLPNEMTLKNDGQKSLKSRLLDAELWGTEGDKAIISLATLQSIAKSMDWSIKDGDDNKNIEELVTIALSWSWGFDEFTQWIGRFPRPEAKTQIPIKVLVLEAKDTVDQGLYKINKWKELYFQIVISGIKLEGEDQRFFNSLLRNTIVTDRPDTSHLFLWDSLKKLQGKSSKEAIEELSRKINGTKKDGWTHYAEGYYREGKDEFAIVGNNAELVKDVLESKGVKSVISLGAGSCLLARKALKSNLDWQIDNIDYNLKLLELVKEKHPNIGNIIRQNAVDFSLEESQKPCDAVDLSYMLSWMPNIKEAGKEIKDIERVKVLINTNASVRMGGTVIITLPLSKVDSERFKIITVTLEKHFGLKISGPSGRSFACDIKPKKPLGWIWILEKIAEVDLKGFNPESLNFLSDISRKMIGHKKDTHGAVSGFDNDYPIFSFKTFQVINPITEFEHQIRSELKEKPLNTLDLKNYLGAQDLRVWNYTKSRVERIFEDNGQQLDSLQSERILREILSSKDVVSALEVKSDTILRIVESEARRISKNEKLRS